MPRGKAKVLKGFREKHRVLYVNGETGTVTDVNNYYVFVRYDGDRHSKATRPEDLVRL